MKLLKLETLKSLPARGYAYLFAKTDKSLAYVDENGLETNLLAGKPDPNLPAIASIPYTAFDFSNTPNGPLPANDAYGNPIFVYAPDADGTPIIDNGSMRVTTIGDGAACYVGLKQNGVIYEMGGTVILGDGVAAFVITQGTPIFTNWSWPLHCLVSFGQVVIQLFNAGAGVTLKTAGLNLSKTEPTNVVIKFRNNTVYVFINGVFVAEATDSRISSFPRIQSIFEPANQGGNTLYTRFISGYVKTAKQSSTEITGVVNPPARQVEVTIPSLVTLTGTYQQILGNTAMPNIGSAMVTVRMRLNQTSAGDILIDVRGFTINAVTTNNITTLSKTIKDDIVTVTLLVNGIGGGWLQVWVMGAFGTIPATGTNDKMLVSVVPTAWTS